MVDVMSQIVSEVRRNRFTSIRMLSDEDVSSVWEAVAQFVERHMSMQKGVQIPGLGVFGFSQKKLDVGNNKPVLIQRPVFQLSEKFAQTHRVEHDKHRVEGHIPVVQLNYTVLSLETPFDRDVVERCVKEVLQAFSRSVHKNSSVEFTFSGIGRLTIRDSKMKMKFFKEFINSMDSSGNLMNAFLKRAGTADSALSVVSGNTPRPFSSSTAMFPRIVQSASANAPLALDTDSPPYVETRRSTRSSHKSMPAIREGPMVSQNNSSASEDEDAHAPHVESERHTSSPVPADTARSQQTPPEGAKQPSSSSPKFSQTSPPTRSSRSRSSATPAPKTRPPTCSHGPKTGQELCYLCHQREAKNIAVSFTEERRARELYEDRLLQHYQQQKDSLAIAREQVRDATCHESNRKMAKFNFDTSEIRKAHIKQPPSDNEFQKSYVFDKRPATEPTCVKQEHYSKELEKQLSKQKAHMEALTQEKDVLERLEQIQLAEELAASREAYLQDKAWRSYHYQRALSEQIRFKPAPLPAAEPDSSQPIFGVHDATASKLRAKRRRAEDVFQAQLCAESEKRLAAARRHRMDQQEEQEMLHRTRRELAQDMKLRRDVRLDGRRDLERSWFDCAEKKRQLETHELELDKDSGMLVHEQCDKYERCHQCQRRKENVGKSNILKETRYIAGSRLIV